MPQANAALFGTECASSEEKPATNDSGAIARCPDEGSSDGKRGISPTGVRTHFIPHARRRPVKSKLVWGELTEEAVCLIAWRVGKGLTVPQACLAHDPLPINPETFAKAMRQVPQWQQIFERERSKFLVEASEILWQGDVGNVRRTRSVLEILQRRHAKEWAMTTQQPIQVDLSTHNTTNYVIDGVAQDQVTGIQQRIAELRRLPKLPPAQPIDVEEVKPSDGNNTKA